MNFIASLIQFLNKPFPKEGIWFGFSKNLIGIIIFSTLFLYIFQPSGISEVEDNKFLICLGFGISTAFSFFIYEFVFDQIVKLRKEPIQWTFGKWLIYSIVALLCISLGNFLYARLLIFGYIIWGLFPAMIKGVFLFGLPMLGVGVITMMQEEKRYQSIAAEINQNQLRDEAIVADDDLPIFNIPVKQIKYIEALQNYVTVGFVDGEGQLKTQVERATLKSILDLSKGSTIVKTHRSYLVNRQAIIDLEGNSQGLLLTLSDCEKKIPVSRSYVSAFK